MKIIKTLSILLIGIMTGSIVHFYAFADKVSVELSESSYQQAVLMLKDHEAKYDKVIEARTQDIQSIMQQYREPLSELSKLKKQAKELVCKRESDLAQVKLAEYYQDKLPLTTQDVQRLTEKSEWTCGVTKNASLNNISQEGVAVQLPPPLGKVMASKPPMVESSAVLLEKKDYDLECLAAAVAVAETSYCQEGSGLTRNNCFGIMAWTPEGKRYLKAYPNNEASFDDFKRIWSEYYRSYPNLVLARKWTGNDNATTWLANVNGAYNRCNDRKTNQ